MYNKHKVYYDEFDKEEFNFYEFVNTASQAARLLNDQEKLGIVDLKSKTTITEAIDKVLDGRIIRLNEDEID